MNVPASLLVFWLLSAPVLAHAADSGSAEKQCSEQGKQYSDDLKDRYDAKDANWGNPEFHYSNALQTCLVYTEVVDGSENKDFISIWYYRRVTDIYNHRILAYSRYFIYKNDKARYANPENLANTGDVENLPSEKFAAKKAELMGQ